MCIRDRFWIFNAIVAFAFPITLSYFGGMTFFLFAVVNVFSIIFCLRCVPETRGLSLEEIERLMERRFAGKSDSRQEASVEAKTSISW